MKGEIELNEITGCIVNSALQIHKKFKSGLFESLYATTLEYDLKELGFKVEREKSVTITYKTLVIENAFRADMVVENCVVVEVKSVRRLPYVFTQQLPTYVQLLDMPVGLLINFGEELLKDGIRRVANTM